jgi:DNA-binding transcriptional MerR regulator
VSSPTAKSATSFEPVEIPNKLYFRIGDVSELTGIKPYVLRYWETEFPTLAPKKSGTNQRLYRRKDVEQVLEIKHLLYAKRFTIEGARTFLHGKDRGTRQAQSVPAPPAQAALFGPDRSQIQLIRNELREILGLLG